jgi:sarcosine oxidase gamma subunit
MFERSSFWSAPPEWSGARIERPGLSVAASCGPAQLVAGSVEAWLAARSLAVSGPRQTCTRPDYALRLAPDTLLIVGAVAASPGWHAEHGVAISDAGDAWILIDVEGEGAPALLAQGCEYPFPSEHGAATESARMLFAGLVVAVSRRAAGWRLHVDRAWAPALWRWLEVHATSSHS